MQVSQENPGLGLDQNPVLPEALQKILRGDGTSGWCRPMKALRWIVELRVNAIEITGAGNGVGENGSPGGKIAARFHDVGRAGWPRNTEMELSGAQGKTAGRRRRRTELVSSDRRDADPGQNSCEKNQESCGP